MGYPARKLDNESDLEMQIIKSPDSKGINMFLIAGYCSPYKT